MSQRQFSHWDFHLKFGPKDAQSYVLLFPWQPIAWSQIAGRKMPLVVSNLKRSTWINKGWWRSSKIYKETYSRFLAIQTVDLLLFIFRYMLNNVAYKFNAETFRCMKFKPWHNWSSQLVGERPWELIKSVINDRDPCLCTLGDINVIGTH